MLQVTSYSDLSPQFVGESDPSCGTVTVIAFLPLSVSMNRSHPSLLGVIIVPSAWLPSLQLPLVNAREKYHVG